MSARPPTSATLERIGKIVGTRPTAWRRVDKGYTVADRWVIEAENAKSVFVKHATDADTASWLRAEHEAYRALDGDFLPRFIGWDAGDDPILVMEDLSGGYWPPPWSADRIARVVRLLDRLAQIEAPKQLPSLAADSTVFNGWQTLAKDPSGFLGLGLVSETWLAHTLPVFARAEANAVLAGNALVHGDPRSDNICLHQERTLLVDWNGAARGNPKFDLIAWLPSLHAEGGPAPWTFTTSEPELIAAVSGYFAYRAWQPPHKQGPAIRQLQLAQLKSALPWTAMALGLDPGPLCAKP